MFPILTPIILPKPDETEYRREQILFAEMQMEFHERNAKRLQALRVRHWILLAFETIRGRQALRSAASSSTSLNLIDSPQPQASSTLGLRNLNPASSSETS